MIEKGKLVSAPKRPDLDSFQFPIRRSQYDIKKVSKMILTKKSIKSSLHEVRKQINRRVIFNNVLHKNQQVVSSEAIAGP